MQTNTMKQLNESKMFIPFIVAGDPHPDITIELAISLQDVGASVIELGIPYSDPLADGPTIQRAASRALKNKVNLESAMNLVSIMRERGLKIPVIVFTYYNPVLQLGEDYFFKLAKKNQIDGLLIPDLPFEESEELRERSKKEGMQFISLIAPTSTKRIEKIAKDAQGFLYCVSSLGVTGTRDSIDSNVFSFLELVKEHSQVPVAVGFGISNCSQVKVLKDHCDGVIVGSAIVKKIEELEPELINHTTREKALIEFKSFVKEIISPITT
ncbi:tryptophan synthase subunit alpha [Bacillus timonensis]|nr:tryptophan synthase subunit alpha [Bacillus timonensis]